MIQISSSTTHDTDTEIDDAHVLEILEPSVREWWKEEFGEYTDINNGYFTPPQKEAIPLIHEGENSLICAPTGSGKCVKPDTPMVIKEDGNVEVVRARELLERRNGKVADVDETGELYESNISSFSFNDGEIEENESLIYSEKYTGTLYEIETVYGRQVEVTPDHPLMVETEDGFEWRSARDIKEGDRIGAPKEMELPEKEIELNVEEAINALRQKFKIVVTHEDSERIIKSLDQGLDSLSEEDMRKALAMADLSISEVSRHASVSTATTHGQVVKKTRRTEDVLGRISDELESVDRNEIVVKTENGKISRFRYPTEMDAELSRVCAFVLAEGLLNGYEKSDVLMLSQNNREDLLHDVLNTFKRRFDVGVRQKTEIDYVVGGSAFAVFFSELFRIGMGRSRDVNFPDWILNSRKEIKKAFISTFFSLEAEVRENHLRVTQANEMKIEQLTYLLLSFRIFSSRRTDEKRATNSDGKARNYYTLTVRGKPNISKLVSEFDIRHPNIETLEDYAAGETSGGLIDKHAFDYRDIRSLSEYYDDNEAFIDELGNIYEVVRRSGMITQSALDKLEKTVEELPDDETISRISEKIRRLKDTNAMWLEVKDISTKEYEGQIIDMSVPDTHNFVGGRGALYMHNTLASFTSIINELFIKSKKEDLENSVYCLYISPLKSLANDIHRNLEVPLEGIVDIARENGHDPAEIDHAIRHGDTSSNERQKMLRDTPHILNTTPETLAILLNSPKFREKLRTVEYVIVDEIHSLADNKRGTHLSVSLERLENLCHESPVRIGCSATVEPLDKIAEFLVGYEDGEPRESNIVDTRFVRDFDIRLKCPTDDLIHTPNDEVQDSFYSDLHDLIQSHKNTLIFTNTRSGAERILHNLRERFEVYDDTNSGCHHGSLGKSTRKEIEEKLKDGELDVVTSSTSLELGVDMPYLDLVVQVGSPKSVAALLQRIGRAGHSLGQTVEGRVFALDRDELIECGVMLKKAEEGFIDRVFIPEKSQDVLAQHVYGMAINAVTPEREMIETVKRAYPYRDYTREEWEILMKYLTAQYDGMEDKSIYAKVWRDEDDETGQTVIGKRGRLARMIYMTNIGTIPDSFTCDVLTRGDKEWVGDLDESYLDKLQKGDVFVLGGNRYEFKYRRGSKVYVDPTGANPTVPSWFSERLPLSYDLGCEILRFKRKAVDKIKDNEAREWLKDFPLDDNSVESILRIFDEQLRYSGEVSVSNDRRFVIEQVIDKDEYRRYYYFHSNYGRKFNDGLSRIIAHEMSKRTDTNVKISIADNGFALSMPLNRKVNIYEVIDEIKPDNARSILRGALKKSELLKRMFRINATRSLMILKNYKGHTKSAKRQQVNSDMLINYAEGLDDFMVIEETYREVMEDKLDIDHIQDVLEKIHENEIDVFAIEPDTPTPMAFGIASLAASDVVLAEDKSSVLQEFHDRVMDAIGD